MAKLAKVSSLDQFFGSNDGQNEDLPTILINFNPFLMGFHGDQMESRSNDMILALFQNPS